MKMRLIFLFVVLNLFANINLLAQSPQFFNYQAVVRDIEGVPLGNQNVTIKITLMQGGAPIYNEVQNVFTNSVGLVNLKIGGDNSFEEINWASGGVGIQVDIDPMGGSTFTINGYSDLLSVPYALYSNRSGVSEESNNNSTFIQDLQITSDKLTITGNANASPIDLSIYRDNTDSQTLSINNRMISILGGNFIYLPNEVDPIFRAWSQANDSFIIDGQTAFTWGDHSKAGYLLGIRNLGDLENPQKALVNLGITATSQELNFVNGVASSIQTQLDSKLNSNTAITAGTKTKITYDEKGLVTAGTDATTADIASSIDKNYITDAQLTVVANTSGTNTGDQDISGINTNATGITTNTTAISGKVDLNAEITASTKTKITYDEKGLVTDGADATTADIASSTNKNYVTDTQVIVIGNTSGTNTGDQDISGIATNATAISGKVDSNTSITAGTKTKITYDAKGLVTAGTFATTADIAASTNKNYVTDAQLTIVANTSGTNTGDQDISGINTNATGITTNATAITGKVDSNTAITAGTNTKITYDEKGLVTAGDDATTADIASSTDKNYITDAQVIVIGNTSGTNTGDQDISGIATNATAITGKVDSNTAITAGTKTKITYDAKGLVTAGDEATTADIAASTNKNYVTDAQLTIVANTNGTNTGDQDISGIATNATAISGKVDSNTSITASTKTKITYDENGLVTAGDDATTADIAFSTDKNYITDAQLTIVANTSGTNTGDQDISGIATNATAISGKVDSNTSITAGTKTKITYDEKGLVTAGTDATTADIATSTNKNYVTDTQVIVIGNTSGTNTGDQNISGIATNATAISGKVDSNTSITASTKTKITYDEKGLVTAGVDATTADIATSTNKNYVTDTQVIVIGNTSGTNTGDQDISGIATNATAISGKVDSNTSITAGTKTKITYDAKGLVTAGADASKADFGLGNVDNTSDETKNTAIATLTNKTLTNPKLNENVALTATATELNILDGITATTTELNYVDGVTSAIQAQLDAKETNASHTGDVTGSTTLTIDADKVLESHLKIVNTPTDEYVLTYESTTGDFEWQASSSGASAALSNLANVAINTSLISDTDNTDDLGSVSKEWKDLYINGTANLDAVDIDAGEIDGTAIGTNSANTGAFTTLGASGATTLNSTLKVQNGTTINEFSIDGTLVDNSDDAIPSEKAVKTYVDANANATHTGDVTGSTTLVISADKVLESHLKAVNLPTDEYVLTYESTTSDFEWQAISINDLSDGKTNSTGVFLGSGAGTNTTGDKNTAVGAYALQANTTSASNTAIGYYALKVSTSGANTAVGAETLKSSVTTTGNTAIGDFNLKSLTSGNDNTAIGSQALVNLLAGTSNVALGRYALGSALMGADYNTAIGTWAMRSGTGSNNIGIGYYSMYSNDGDANIGIGHQTLHYNNGDNNIAIGYQALKNLEGITDDGNVAIGQKAGILLTSGTKNIFLGDNAGPSGSSVSNKLYIHNSLSDTPLIYGDFTASSEKVTINGDFHVTGDVTYAGAIGSSSDSRLKTKVETLTDVLLKISKLRGVSFVFINEDRYASGPQVGVIAQELQMEFPELVIEGDDGYLGVNYSQLSAVLLQAVKEQQVQIDLLKSQMATIMKKLGI